MRKIIGYKHYFKDFMDSLSKKEAEKVYRALTLFAEADDKLLPRHYIKHLCDGIYEFRTNYGSNEFRIFYIYDGDTIVVLFNGFRKKTQKTPKKELEKAIALKKEYYENK